MTCPHTMTQATTKGTIVEHTCNDCGDLLYTEPVEVEEHDHGYDEQQDAQGR